MKIIDCNAEVDSKKKEENFESGRTMRKGTTYVLQPGLEGVVLEGEDLEISVIGKTFKKVRGFKRPVHATFSIFPEPGNATIIF